VRVTATRTAPTFFLHVLGFDSVTVTATAQATVESYTSYASTGNVMPFGVMKNNYVLGQSYTIYGDGSSSNSGALSLDISSGGNCSAANGANDFRDTINGGDIACPVSVGEDVDTKPGSNTGPVAQGLNSRITTWESFNQIVQPGANGQYTLLDPASPQLRDRLWKPGAESREPQDLRAVRVLRRYVAAPRRPQQRGLDRVLLRRLLDQRWNAGDPVAELNRYLGETFEDVDDGAPAA